MKRDIGSLYRMAWRFAISCPILFLIPVLVEFIQHLVELNGGMYDGAAGARAMADDPTRMAFGMAKVMAITLPSYWFARYILMDGDAVRARRVEWPAAGLWLVLFTIATIAAALSLFGPALRDIFALSAGAGMAASVLLGLVQEFVSIYLIAWGAAWTVGNTAIGPLRSVGIMRGSFWYTVGLMIAAIVPLMFVHYGLAISAIKFAPPAADWALMAFDALVTGFLALLITGSSAVAARHAANRKGIALLPA